MILMKILNSGLMNIKVIARTYEPSIANKHFEAVLLLSIEQARQKIYS